MTKSRENTGYFLSSILNSYSQVFFSTNKTFAVILLLVTFYDIYAGLAGLFSVVITSSVAFILNLNKPTTAKGLYGFNSLLVGLGLGIYYSFGWHLLLIVFLAALLTFFISVSLQGIIGKYNLPYLSVPFIFSLWIFISATRNFEALGISERGIYTLNELYQVGGDTLIRIHEYFNALKFPKVVTTYFISLSAILFQYSILTGMVVALGILIYSRIAFSLSVIGFTVAYLFYGFIGANITEIDYSYIGFNYILTAIALGGFFVIPSVRSYFWVIVLIPLVAIVTISLHSIFLELKLPVYSLPFNLVVLLFLYMLKFRTEYSYHLAEAYYQYNAPEKNLYIFLNNTERFRYANLRQIKLPFFGTWDVSQGHNGSHTHKNEYRYAWDFIILDKNGKQYKNEGNYPDDYYCFGKPVIAPDDGTVEMTVTDIDDNIIGQVNLQDNWGNTIIIKHGDDTYSKLNHLKKESITVSEGDKVKYGQRIAQCGNSGRSPFPHLHFQVQEFPFIGSATIDYPISNYVVHDGNNYSFESYKIPSENQKVSNIEANELLKNAFDFTPGKILKFNVSGYANTNVVSWEIKVDPYNETYMECNSSGAIAYFKQDENQFQFTYFEGRKNSLLYYFFLGCFRVQKGFYQDLVLNDRYPVSLVFPRSILWAHDFISPFFRLVRSEYSMKYLEIDDYMNSGSIRLQSDLKNMFMKQQVNSMSFEIIIQKDGLEQFEFNKKGKQIKLERCEEQ
ncbi:MAG: urea transporter [Bacteroidales bacterium]|nr:urea transporter [Bacteroidales bacterium]